MRTSKERFIFLDGMRGLAALAVLWLHTAEAFRLSFHPIHTPLAVDFFFCLSGFVVAYAYDSRIKTAMSTKVFMTKRLVRLYPMLFLGVALGWTAAVYATPRSAGELAAMALAAFALVPLGLFVGQMAYPTNYPMWSLVFELIACLGYSLGTKRFTDRFLLGLLGVCGLLLCVAIYFAGQVSTFGFMGYAPFAAGLIRVAYPFLAGVLIFRSGVYRNLPRSQPLILAAILAAVLLAPTAETRWYDMAATILVLPALVAFGATAPDSASAIWLFLGRISYPLYLVHYPVLKTIGHATKEWDISRGPVAILAVLCAIAAAYAALVLYDIPLRKRLERMIAVRAGIAAA